MKAKNPLEFAKSYFLGLFSQFLLMLKSLTFKDYALLFIVPLVITSIFLLPSGFQENLPLKSGDGFRVWQVFTAEFSHVNFNHYFNNMVMFVLVFAFIVAFSKMLGFRDRMPVLLLSVIVVIPLVLAPIDVFFLGFNSFQGFSGEVGAMFGVLLAFSVVYLQGKYSALKNLNVSLVPVYLFAVAVLSWFLGCIPAVVLNSVFLLYLLRKQLMTPDFAVLFSFAVIAALPFFFQLSSESGIVSNSAAHFIGVLMGFHLASFLIINRSLK